MRLRTIHFLLLIFLTVSACELNSEQGITDREPEEPTPAETDFIRGADLSYVNEMLDCGATYYNSDGQAEDPYVQFGEAGTNLARFRLWHNPDWTDYSDYADVKQAIARAKAEGMNVLLDFHYSDDWADPGRQHIPEAWLPVVNNTQALGDSVYNYTYKVLTDLANEDLLPEYVQVGNETNAEILQDPNQNYGLNWSRNASLLNRGLRAVRDVAEEQNAEIELMLHIAQPENALWWFREATENGIVDYDWIAISYYPLWSDYNLENLPTAIATLTDTYDKRLMVVETAYPFTLDNADNANNIMGSDALVSGFPASPDGQYDYLVALEEAISEGGGEGLIYWEPAWVSTSCRTQWAQGSHWDNATLFDQSNIALKGMTYFGLD